MKINTTKNIPRFNNVGVGEGDRSQEEAEVQETETEKRDKNRKVVGKGKVHTRENLGILKGRIEKFKGPKPNKKPEI